MTCVSLSLICMLFEWKTRGEAGAPGREQVFEKETEARHRQKNCQIIHYWQTDTTKAF